MSRKGSANAANPNLKIDTDPKSSEDAPISSLLASWNEIIGATTQINSPVPSSYSAYGDNESYITPPASNSRNQSRASYSGYSPLGASLGDSLDLSNADFEVGTIAARKSMEKANLRGYFILCHRSSFIIHGACVFPLCLCW
jgi:hypothetical protein